MNILTLVSKVKRTMAKDFDVPVRDLAEEHGYRFRITNETKQLGENVIEVGNTYFYESQARVDTVADDFVFYANHLGINVRMTPVHDNVRYTSKPWPKTSWATLFYEVEILNIDQQCA